MLLLHNRLVEVPVMSLQTGAQIGVTAEPIIDPRKLNIVAFYCEGPNIDFSPAILHISDIREIGSLGIIVDGADDIMPPDDLVRLQEVLDFHFELVGKHVVDTAGMKMGKVDTYSVDPNSFYIMKLHVKPNLLQSLTAAELLIDRSQIETVNDKHVVVKRAGVKAKKPAMALKAPVIENPFRHAKPQSQAAEHKAK